MDPDSPAGPLPLAEALLAWSEPRLLDAVRAAERRLGKARVQRLGRDLLATITNRRMRPHSGRTLFLHSIPHLQALDVAWDALLDAFKLKVERGEILLEGTQIEPVTVASRSRIPGHWASKLDLDPRGCAVFFQGRTFAPVFARQAPPDPLNILRLEPVANGRGFDLRDAIVRWCDQQLVRRVRMLEQLVVDVNQRTLRWPRLFAPTGDKFDLLGVPADDTMRSSEKLAETWQALLLDLRRRIERGEIALEGVQSFPTRQLDYVKVPGVWAADLQFDLDDNKVSVVQRNVTEREFGAVVARRATPAGRIAPAAMDVPLAAAAPAPPHVEAERMPSRPSRAGRMPLPLYKMVELAVEFAGEDWPNRKAAADALHSAFKARYPGERPPALRTIEDHVAEIYKLRAKRAAP